MTPTAKPRPTDATGVARARETKKHADAVKARAAELTTIAAQEAFELENSIFDPSVEGGKIEIVDEVLDPTVRTATQETVPAVPEPSEVEVSEVTLEDDKVIVRLIADIPTMVFGVGNEYSFEAGKKYLVSKELAGHLETLGYLYTM
jgi:hypothetical protein